MPGNEGASVKDVLLYFAIMVVGGIVFLPLHIVSVRARGGAKLITTLIAVNVVSTLVAVAVGWLVLGDLFSSPGAAMVACVAGGLSFAAYAGLYSLLLPSS